MKDRVETCYDKIRKDIRNWSLVIIVVIILGFTVSYFKLKAKIYHTYFMNKETIEKLNDVNIDLNKSTGHMIIEKN